MLRRVLLILIALSFVGATGSWVALNALRTPPGALDSVFGISVVAFLVMFTLYGVDANFRRRRCDERVGGWTLRPLRLQPHGLAGRLPRVLHRAASVINAVFCLVYN